MAGSMKYDLVISGKVADPVDGIYDASVGIEKNKIRKIGGPLDGKNSIQLTSSQMLFPGFIDTHVHLREPGWEYKEDFVTGSRAALHGGVTTVGDMPNLPEPIVTKERLLKKMELAKKALIDILHLGGVGKDSMPEIKNLGPLVPAFKIYTAKSTGELTIGSWDKIEEAVRIISKLGKPITFHCEDPEILGKAAESLTGRDYAWKHCDERPPEAETIAVEKVSALCKKHDARASITHVSAAESVKIISENPLLTCEVAPHHLFFKKQDMRMLGNLLKINPPLRTNKDRKALVRSLKEGKISTLSTDHSPHTLEEKNSANPPSGMPWLDTYGNIALWLMDKKKIKPQTVAKVTSFNAACYFGIKDKGRIKEKFIADLTVLDTKGKTKIRNENMETKCGWSPLNGMELPGKVVYTIKSGRISMRDGIIR